MGCSICFLFSFFLCNLHVIDYSRARCHISSEFSPKTTKYNVCTFNQRISLKIKQWGKGLIQQRELTVCQILVNRRGAYSRTSVVKVMLQGTVYICFVYYKW